MWDQLGYLTYICSTLYAWCGGDFPPETVDAPDWSCPEHKTPFRSRASVWCQSKTLGREINILIWRKEYHMNEILNSNQKLTSFLMEMEMYLYPLELSSWVWIFWISITIWTTRYEFLVTAWIALLDYWDSHAEISTTIYNNPHWYMDIVIFWTWGWSGSMARSANRDRAVQL